MVIAQDLALLMSHCHWLWLTLVRKTGWTFGCCVCWWIWLVMLLLLYQDIYSFAISINLATLTNQVIYSCWCSLWSPSVSNSGMFRNVKRGYLPPSSCANCFSLSLSLLFFTFKGGRSKAPWICPCFLVFRFHIWSKKRTLKFTRFFCPANVLWHSLNSHSRNFCKLRHDVALSAIEVMTNKHSLY